MSDLRSEIDKIIKVGVKKDLETKVIVDQILALMTQEKKHEHVSAKEFEELLREGKQRIREIRKLLISSISGSAV